jgi:hypothetical protein
VKIKRYEIDPTGRPWKADNGDWTTMSEVERSLGEFAGYLTVALPELREMPVEKMVAALAGYNLVLGIAAIKDSEDERP